MVVFPRSIFTSTLYDVVDVLPLVASHTLMGFSFAMAFIPAARTKSGDMASSSEPLSQHTNASVPLILRTAVRQCPTQTFG